MKPVLTIFLLMLLLNLSHSRLFNAGPVALNSIRVPTALFGKIKKRKVSTSSPIKPVRVRFAPSPTGSLHVGGARTALFNWLLARKTNGTFIVRVEDTDTARSTKQSEASILNDLKWLQMDWDEGPDKEGGQFGPYRQSERTEIYKKHAEELIEKGWAYRCFSTEEELERQRVDAAGQGLQNIGYLGTWRDADPAEVKRRLDAGEPYAVRFRVPPNKILVLRDAVRGLVTWNCDAMLGDFVIMRSNGMPVYNFCVAVDDAAMNVTHVIRAEEHLSNTPKQMLVLEALGCKTPPTYAHCSLILAQDRSKLSKRHGATSVAEFAAQGFTSNAMINYLCNLGWNSGQKKEIYLPNELIKLFDLSRIIPSAAVFDMRKLKWVNGQHLNLLPPEQYAEEILSQLRTSGAASSEHGPSAPMLKYYISALASSGSNDKANSDNLPIYHGDEEKKKVFIEALINVLRKDVQVTNEVRGLLTDYITYPIYDTLIGPDTRPLEVVEDYHRDFLAICKFILRDYSMDSQPGNPWSGLPTGMEADIEKVWKSYADKIKAELIASRDPNDPPLTNGIVMMSLRIALTGRSKGPNVGHMLAFLKHGAEFIADTGDDSKRLVPLADRMRTLETIVGEIEKILLDK